MAIDPHQIQRVLDIRIDSDRPLTMEGSQAYPRIYGNYVRIPRLRNNEWTKTTLRALILVAAKRHSWRMELEEELRNLDLGDDDGE